jgi:hypothetical protein
MAQNPRLVTTSGTAALLWQTSTGVPPDTALNSSNGIYRAGTFNDPLPIIIENQDATNSVTLGGSGVTAGGAGTILVAGASITRNVAGNDSEYVIANAGTPKVSVQPGRQ